MKYGIFFEQLVGKYPSEFESLIACEQAVEDAIGKTLPVCAYPSNLISSRGSVFPVISMQADPIEESFFDL